MGNGVCEHGDHPTIGRARFCSKECLDCDMADFDATRVECAGICTVPVQGDRDVPSTRIPVWLAREAYSTYAALFGSSQSFERIHERGGFGRAELIALLVAGYGIGRASGLAARFHESMAEAKKRLGVR